MGRILNWILIWVGVVIFFAGGVVRGAEVIPPVPAQYFNDYSKVISKVTAQKLNFDLADFEKATSNQVVVAIYLKMQSDSDVADYTVRVAQAWRVGGKLNKNGVAVFVFVEPHKVFIQVGYGLEGALPDAICKEIIDQMTPYFKEGDYDTGIQLGVAAIISATKGEYKGVNAATTGPVGQTERQRREEDVKGLLPCIGSAVGVFVLFGLLLLILHNMGGKFYQNHRRSIGFFENSYLFILSMVVNIISSGSSGSGSSSSGGGGGFSSGGGSFGGGGAGGSW